MKVFITGINGYLGKELAIDLQKEGYTITGCDIIGQESSGVHLFDIRSEKIFDIIPENVDVIIHLAALSSDPLCNDNAYECFDLNVMGTLNLLRCAELKKCKQLIFASSEWVYNDNSNKKICNEKTLINPFSLKSEYALSKLTSEINLMQKYHDSFFHITILRFGIIYGGLRKNGSAVEAIVDHVLKNDSIEVGSKKTGRNFIHFKDILSAIIASIGYKGFNIFNISGDEFVDLYHIICIAEQKLQKNILVTEKEKNNPSIRMVSNNYAKNKLNWKPIIDIEKGIGEIIKYRK